MAEAGEGSGHTPLTPEWTPAPRASHYPWQGDRPAAAPSLVRNVVSELRPKRTLAASRGFLAAARLSCLNMLIVKHSR